ncbi:hypothetical protein AcV5_006529 [Taiwanofungus camphoratus]|nr:hypothetical protein AcV5_006529 [Antrodia cinnamomea]KAI0949906.1 hypothetical protein AcV7_008537 [Antrodia cinnamomea]
MDANPNPPSKPATTNDNSQRIPSNNKPASAHDKPRKARHKHHDTAATPEPPTDNRSAASRISNVRDQPQHDPLPRFTAHLQPYPGPTAPPYVMNPPYPMNGNPYPSSPSPFHQPPSSGSPTNNGGGGPHVGPGIPGHAAPPPYSYVHHPTYHGYPSYPQYPASGMMLYGTPPTSHPDTVRSPVAASPVPSAPTTGKRKRKSAHDSPHGRTSNEEGADSGSDMARTTAQNVNSGIVVVDTKKRTKTQRACDSCRSRKIRCDVLPDSDPPICQHCKQYGFECTFFLPITETRFKKKKLEEDAAAAAAVADKEKQVDRSTSSPQAESSGGGDVKIYGPTSALHMLHSHPMLSSRVYESFDMRYHHSWDVSASGEGIIRVHEPQQGELQLALPKPVDMHIERDVVERLVNAYFAEIAPLLPVVTQAEFVASSPPPPVLLYAICLVAAARRDVPQSVFDTIRYAVNSLIKAEDVLSTASIVNMQALLILAMCGDCHSQYVPNALSALWLRLGSAIRMAQDLGLHRAESVKQNIELRRRLWGICLISDRWTSLLYGHPYLIDVRDCDVRLPSSGDPNDRYMDEFVRLSVILGRVHKAIYTPAGLTMTNDDELQGILLDIEAWRNNLPEDLCYRGPETSHHAGVLFLFYTCVYMLFWRVFMRISYTCPAHIKVALTVERWTELVQLTGEAIDWLDAHEQMYDIWMLVAYCAVSCALVQYHTWARRRDPDAQAKLKKLRDCVGRWEAALSPDHMSSRRKTAEIIMLLYEATQGPPLPSETPALNPTGGVKGKPPLGGLEFHKDPSRPGGGVFIAHKKPERQAVDGVPEGTIISGDDEQAGAQHHPQQLQRRGSSVVDFTPPDGSYANMNPALNNPTASAPGNVQVMNVLDVPQASNTLEQFALVDNAFLEGIPGATLDWGSWENFFARFAPQTSGYQQQRMAGGGDVNSMTSASSQNQPQASQPQPQYHYPGPSNSGI